MESKNLRVLEKAPAYRWIIWIVMMVNYMVVYTSNQAVASFGVEMMSWMNIGDAALAWMSNGGTIGLMIANIFGGALLVKAIGGKNTMTVGAICELAAGIVWLMAPTNYILGMVLRLIQGFGGGCLSTCSLSLLGCWFPRNERGTVEGVMTGIYGVSIAIFTVIAGNLTMHGAAWYQITGWWMAILGGISAILDIFVLKDLYRTYGVHVIDDAIIGGDKVEVQEKVLDPLTIEKRSHLKKLDSIKAMATSVDFWLYIIIAFILTYFIFGLSYILPLLYVTDLGMTTAESTSAQTWAFIGTFFGCALGGWASDKITKSRRMPVIAFGFILACAFCACVIPGPKMTVGMLTVISFLAMSGAPMASPNTWAVPADLFAPHMITAGTGIALFFSNLGGTVCTAVTGALAQSTGSYYPGLYVMIVVGVFGILAAWILSKKYRL